MKWGRLDLKVTINGVVQEFSPDTKQERHMYDTRQDKEGSNVYKESVKSPGLGQRMQTDLAKFGVNGPTQKELEVRRRQAILDSLHKKETEKKKIQNSPAFKTSKGTIKMGYKGHLPPIPGSVKNSNSKGDFESVTGNTFREQKRTSNLENEENYESENNTSMTSNNPFMSKPAIIKRKALPGVKKQPVHAAGGGGVTSEDSEITSDYNTSDKENSQQMQLSHRREASQIQTIAETENNQSAERQPLRESHSSNNDSAGTRTLASTRSNEQLVTTNGPGLDSFAPEAVSLKVSALSKADNVTPRQQVASSQSQRPRSVTARDVIEITSAKRRTVQNLNESVNNAEEFSIDNGIKLSHNVVISDTITDLESGLQVESQEKQRLEALQRLNKKTNDERARSAKRLAETLANQRQEQDYDASVVQENDEANLALGAEIEDNVMGMSDTEISGQAMTLRDRNDGLSSSVRRLDSHRSNFNTKRTLNSGIKSAVGETKSLNPSIRLDNTVGANSSQSNAGTGDVKGAIHEMRQREKNLIQAIKKQQEELELVRKQRYRQERIFKSSHHRRAEKFRSESESSRVLSTEEASQSDVIHTNGAVGMANTPTNYQRESSPKKKSNKVRLPPKRPLDIKEDPYYAQIAEKSNPKAIEMVKCEHCGRSFAPERLTKHVEICQNLQAKKRTEYDASKHRLQGTGAESYQNEDTSSHYQVSYIMRNFIPSMIGRNIWMLKMML